MWQLKRGCTPAAAAVNRNWNRRRVHSDNFDSVARLFLCECFGKMSPVISYTGEYIAGFRKCIPGDLTILWDDSVRQFCTSPERTFFDAGDVAWDVYVGKAGAPVEGPYSDSGDVLRDIDAGKASAPAKRATINGGNATGDSHADKSVAPRECVPPDFLATIGNANPR